MNSTIVNHHRSGTTENGNNKSLSTIGITQYLKNRIIDSEHWHNRLRNVATLMILFVTVSSFAQKEINNIYLFDCTGSMKTKGLWEPAKSALDATIATQAKIKGSQFTIIPFGDSPYQSISFNSALHKSKQQEINESFESNIQKARYTNISKVLQAGFDKVDNNLDNKIYLLTDGMPNGDDSPEKVAQSISSWCQNHKNCRLFYVALTNNVINPIIENAINNCSDAFIVQCEGKIIPQIADISSEVYTNLEELDKERDLSFSIPGEFELSIDCQDPLFNVNINKSRAKDNKIKISLSPKNGFDKDQLHQTLKGGEYEFSITLQCVDKRFFIANPIVDIHVTDEIPSILTIGDNLDEIKAEDIKWHDSFLWNSASADKKAEWNLEPVFENELPNSHLNMKFQLPKGEDNDFKAWYNGNPINSGEIITVSPNESAVIQIQFNHDAKEGKRYFNLIPTEFKELDLINDQPSDNYSGISLRTIYTNEWNPLKTILLLVIFLLIAMMTGWLFLLKRIFFPTIKIGRIEIMGPGSYYTSKRIKGYRKIVLTSKRKSQNIISKIFTGKICYIKSDIFSSDLFILPSGSKKRIKVRKPLNSHETWEISPTTVFGQYEKGSITNLDTKDKMDIEFN